MSVGQSGHGTGEGAGRSVTNAGEKSASEKISGLKGQMPVHVKPAVTLLDLWPQGLKCHRW